MSSQRDDATVVPDERELLTIFFAQYFLLLNRHRLCLPLGCESLRNLAKLAEKLAAQIEE
jgi:hypothetical protein